MPMTTSTSSKPEATRDRADNPKCVLLVEELLAYDGLRNGHLCLSCCLGVGTHARKSNDYQTSSTRNKHCQTGFDDEYEQTNEKQLKTSKDVSISPPENDKQSKPTESFSLQSTSSSSIKSLNSDDGNIRISHAPLSSDSETSKQTTAIEQRLRRTARLEASQLRTKKVKLFLTKYCCVEVGADAERLYERLLSSLQRDRARFYWLTQHARYNSLALFQFINTEETVVEIFELLNKIIPSEKQ